MLAVNTLPRPSTLTASTRPVVADSSKSRPGRGDALWDAGGMMMLLNMI
ncbi:hypothetical protein [Sphingobium yanoikuyae]|nr:hypothetical protein [Sphingobium yanoikuyae]